VFGKISSNGNGVSTHVDNQGDYLKFVVKQKGVIYEDEVVQIGCKLETRANLARLGMFYGNKTMQRFTNFQTNVMCPGELEQQLQCQAKPVEGEIEAQAQVQQLLNFVCFQDFSKTPIAHIEFDYAGADGSPKSFSKTLYLPIFISKFFEPSDMSSEQFFSRWRQLNQPAQEGQKVFSATSGIDNEQFKNKLSGLGAQLLSNVDPNPENFVLAGIIHTRAAQIGTLIRLEPNKQAKMLRLTVRTSRDGLATTLCELLSANF